MVRTERGGTGIGHPGVVAAGLVSVAQLLGDRGEIEGEREHQRVRGMPPALAGREGLLQYASRGGRVVGLAMQAGQQVGGAQDLRMVLAEAGPQRVDRVGQQPAGSHDVAGGAQRERPVLECGQGRGL
ncbi:hypothetical protein TK50_25430 [Micromonospora haikouensis]|uniref:Uncharacterized protein n=1 Tax=Micromonospora haikouensis TaxID=686309 RepID=A0A0D0WQX1_9ACTN|nr:hypothetical protein TK50_25430 [Micromonospora haikouensis]